MLEPNVEMRVLLERFAEAVINVHIPTKIGLDPDEDRRALLQPHSHHDRRIR